jgi:hypothetical protein
MDSDAWRTRHNRTTQTSDCPSLPVDVGLARASFEHLAHSLYLVESAPPRPWWLRTLQPAGTNSSLGTTASGPCISGGTLGPTATQFDSDSAISDSHTGVILRKLQGHRCPLASITAPPRPALPRQAHPGAGLGRLPSHCVCGTARHRQGFPLAGDLRPALTVPVSSELACPPTAHLGVWISRSCGSRALILRPPRRLTRV